MARKIIGIIFLSYFLALLEVSFFPPLLNGTPNFLFWLIILYNLLEKAERKEGIIFAFSGGFFLDLFSPHFFGFYLLSLLLFSLFIKLFLYKRISPSFSLRPYALEKKKNY